MARDAHQRRARAADHRRVVRLGQVPGLGRHGPRHASQSALSLDASRARVPVRREGQAPRARHRARDLRPLQPPPGRGRLHHAGPAQAVRRGRGVQHRRSDRRSRAAPAARAQPARDDQAVPDLAPRQGARCPRPRGLEPVGRQAAGGVERVDRQLRFVHGGARHAPRLLPRGRLSRVRPRAGSHLRRPTTRRPKRRRSSTRRARAAR